MARHPRRWSSVAASDDARTSALRFLVSGIGLTGLGMLARRSVKDTGRLPAEFGATLLAIGIPVAVLLPASGGWALIALGAAASRAISRAVWGNTPTPVPRGSAASLITAR